MALQRQQGVRRRADHHEGVLGHEGFRWAISAVLICAFAVAGYVLIDAGPGPRGGTWYGYLLGTFGAALIVWLSLLGIRKRSVSSGAWSLKAWTSAHIYLGLSLIVIATLHAGFHFGWNVHTLAYALMILVIVSGLFGVIAYALLPRQLSANRAGSTQKQWLERLRNLDVQLAQVAHPLPQIEAEMIRSSIERTDIGGSFWQRLFGAHGHCSTTLALARIADIVQRSGAGKAQQLAPAIGLLEQKRNILAQARRHIRLRALLQIWLYVHVPVTVGLIGALTVHVISVFFYW